MPRVPIEINLGNVKLNNVDHLSSVSVGKACKINRNVAAKKNQGFGQQHADGVRRVLNVHWTLDDEAIDAISIKVTRYPGSRPKE
ncbi:hypothetical protein [Cohnella caldifontis]|uniref:hypothetical protein n=1 Tax=Cohnella caldifontis TaxID=3027471 RepID=UPI0023EBA656|nr:hypothetical protein [Cohnella sp. YIM B05605]